MGKLDTDLRHFFILFFRITIVAWMLSKNYKILFFGTSREEIVEAPKL